MIVVHRSSCHCWTLNCCTSLLQLLAYVGTHDSLRNARVHACEAVRLSSSSSSDSSSSHPNGSGSSVSIGSCDNAWALTLLAEICYLHWCAGLARKPAGRSFLTKPSGSSNNSGGASSKSGGGNGASVDGLLGGGEIGWGGRTTAELSALALDLSKSDVTSSAATAASSAVSDAGDESKSDASSSGSSNKESGKAAAAISRDPSLSEDVALHCLAVDALQRLAVRSGKTAPSSSSSSSDSASSLAADFPFVALHGLCLAKWNLTRLAAQGDVMIATAAAASSS